SLAACLDVIPRGEHQSPSSPRSTGTGSHRRQINPRGRLGASNPLPIDYEQCCSDQLNPQGKADMGRCTVPINSAASDAVDGPHSAASKCYRLVCVKARAIQGGEARKRRRRLKFEGIGEDMTT